MATTKTPTKPREGFARRSLRKLPALLRVLVFLLAVWAGFAYLAVRQAEADVHEVMLGLGAELMRYPGSTQGVVRDVEFNGAVVHLMSGSVRQPVDAVLDHFEAKCMELDRMHEQIAEMQAVGTLGAGDPADSDSVIRHDFGPTAFVACLDPGENHDNGDAASIAERVAAFLDSGDLSEVGALRYAYVERHRDGDQEVSQIISMYTDSPINIYEMFPAEGDAVGSDVDGIPRPPDSRRLLSSRVAGQPYGMTLYATEDHSPEELNTWYRARLPEAGWQELAGRAGERVTVDGAETFAVSQGDRVITLLFTESEGVTSASILSSDQEP